MYLECFSTRYFKTSYIERIINVMANGNFAPGDVVFVRFRLYVGPFTSGRGRAIDNLFV